MGESRLLTGAMAGSRWRPWLLLGGILALHAVVNLVWISRDATLRSFDMGPHIEYVSTPSPW